ncbi:MAG TPA: secondary thiamine-phosphate synthase enzyme YjbQ [Dehalococcoidia bacterium]|nr:secondary thiamine-phosphate synthase enzyme YjbQ [Dehalococcoidia bacterium]
MERFGVKSTRREEMIEITRQVQQAVSNSGVREGVALVHVPHTTAAVTVNENADPSVQSDMLSHLAKLVPQDAAFRHAEGNSDAHLKATLTGNSETLPISDGRLALGTWQGIYFCEFDGPRQRDVQVQVLSAKDP